jgi:hypothetical protein
VELLVIGGFGGSAILISDLFAQFDPSVRFVFKYSFLAFWVSNYIILFLLTLPRVFVK